MYLKVLILKASLNIEHSLKVNLLDDITIKKIDEYDIVSSYLSIYSRVLKELEKNRNTSYTKELLKNISTQIILYGFFLKLYIFW